MLGDIHSGRIESFPIVLNHEPKRIHISIDSNTRLASVGMLPGILKRLSDQLICQQLNQRRSIVLIDRQANLQAP